MLFWEQFNGFLQAFLFLYHRLAPFFCHLKDHHKHFEELKSETDILKKNRSKIKEQVEEHERRGKKSRTEVKDWLDGANTAEKEVEIIYVKYQQRKRFLRGWLFNYHERNELGKLTEQKLEEVRDLNGRAQFHQAAYFAPADIIIDIPSAPADEQKEAPGIIKMILGCLKDEEKPIIRIHGIEEIKTVDLAQQIQNKVQGFDHVLVGKVTKEPDFREIRMNIARQLGIPLSEDAGSDEFARAIYVQLDRQKYLLILEDMQSWLDLNQIGIPRPTNKNGCKIVLTTPSLAYNSKLIPEDVQSSFHSEVSYGKHNLVEVAINGAECLL